MPLAFLIRNVLVPSYFLKNIPEIIRYNGNVVAPFIPIPQCPNTMAIIQTPFARSMNSILFCDIK